MALEALVETIRRNGMLPYRTAPVYAAINEAFVDFPAVQPCEQQPDGAVRGFLFGVRYRFCLSMCFLVRF
jgi:hypothetical protein